MAQKDKKRNYRSNGNREYKSDVISMMLQIPEYALDIYNAFPDLFNESAQENDRKAGSVWQKTWADRNAAFCSVL